MLTIEKLKEMKPGEVFIKGEGDFPELSRTDKIKWLAKRGDGYHDWCIYYHKANMSEEYIKQYGYKVFTKSLIKGLVECDASAFGLYRF